MIHAQKIHSHPHAVVFLLSFLISEMGTIAPMPASPLGYYEDPVNRCKSTVMSTGKNAKQG